MVWEDSTSIGCAIEACPKLFGRQLLGWLMSCNYGPGGNYVGKKPYKITPISGVNGGGS